MRIRWTRSTYSGADSLDALLELDRLARAQAQRQVAAPGALREATADTMLTILAFVLALALLIAVHEYGHYRVAVACGVRVLRFSVGFGKTLLRWQPKGSPTEFVIAAFPLGGYVRMLDEREAPVAAA